MIRRICLVLGTMTLVGCAASVERDCGSECSDVVRCEAGELWECTVPERGFRRTFCDFEGGEDLASICLRSCAVADVCDAPTLEVAPAYVCRCP